jgi:hypothetical protein
VYQTIFFERTKCDLPNCGALYEHHTNLVVQTFSNMGIMGKIENVWQGFYEFFFMILKEYKILLILLAWRKQKVVAFYEYKNKVDFDRIPN